MDATESCHMLNQDRSHHPDDVQSAARHDSSHSAKYTSRQSSRQVDTGPAQVGHDLDGGYGWVIVIASFFVAFVVDGIGSSFGLLFRYILAKFDSSAFVASFAGSTFVAFMIMGSISAVLVKEFGFRPVAVLGSALSCLAFVVSVFSPNIYVFIMTFGLLGGCSCGLVFIPSIIIVNEYFHEKRGIANGIISSGSGVGLLVLSPIINLLLDVYSLDGTILFLAGVLLNMCVFSSLFRSPQHSLQHTTSLVDKSEKIAYDEPAVESLSSNLSTDNIDMFSTSNHQDMLKVAKDETDKKTHSAVDVGQEGGGYHRKSAAADPVSSDDHGDNGHFYLEYVLHHLKPGVCGHLHQHTSSHGSRQELRQQGRLQAHADWKSELYLDCTTMQQQMVKHQHSYSVFDIPHWCQDKDQHQVLRYILQRYRHFGDHHKVHHSHATSHRHSQSLSVDEASSCYLAGSIATLLNLHNSFVHAGPRSGFKSIHCLDSMSSQPHNVTELPGDTSGTSEKLIMQNSHMKENVHMDKCQLLCVEHACPTLSEAGTPSKSVCRSCYTGDDADLSDQSELDLPLGYTMAQLLCMPSFHFFCLGAALIQIGYPLAGTFLADYAYQFGLTASDTAILMSLLGGLNICGRLLAGALVSLKMDPLLLNNLSLLLGGAACLMSPLYTQFWSLAVFACMFGFFLGFFCPLQPLIIVKYFGLNTLGSAFGFLSTVKGVASILGAPLAGFIYDVTGQYSMSFIFGGAVFIVSSLVHYLMTFSNKCCRRNNHL